VWVNSNEARFEMKKKRLTKRRKGKMSSYNIYFSPIGEIKKIGYKTFKGMVYQLGLINKRCLRDKRQLEFRVRLPIKLK